MIIVIASPAEKTALGTVTPPVEICIAFPASAATKVYALLLLLIIIFLISPLLSEIVPPVEKLPELSKVIPSTLAPVCV